MSAKSLPVFVKIACVTVFAAALSFTSTQAALAGDARTDPAICQAMQDQSDAVQVRDRALAGGIITRPEPTAGLSCMDQAMGVTGRLGNIFSDRHDDAVPPANTVVFTPELAYPDWGAGDFLVRNLNDAITPMLTSHLGSNFDGVLGAVIGTTAISSKFTDMITGITGTIDDIASQINGFSGQINSILSAINTIQTLAKALNLPLPSPVIIGAVAALEAAQQVADQLMSALQRAMNAAIQPLIGQVMGEIMAPAADMDCNNIDRLWNGAEDAPGLQSIAASGASQNTPFMSISALASGNNLSGIGGGMMSQLQTGSNLDIIQRAYRNMMDGAISEPGRTPSWRAAPIIPVGATARDVVLQMRGGQQ